MTDTEVLSLIQKALHEVAPERTADFENIELSTTIDELSLDSIATMEMVGFLEDNTDRVFPDEELTKVNSIANLANLVRTGLA